MGGINLSKLGEKFGELFDRKEKNAPQVPASAREESLNTRRELGRQANPQLPQLIAQNEVSGTVFKKTTAQIGLVQGEQIIPIAASSRKAIGPIEIAQTTMGPGFVEKQILGIPVWKRGERTPLSDQVHEQAERGLRPVKQPEQRSSKSAKDVQSVLPDSRSASTAVAQTTPEQQSKNLQALLAKLGDSPSNQQVFNAIHKHYGKDYDKTFSGAAVKEFGIDVNKLITAENKNNVFGTSAPKEEIRRAIPVEAAPAAVTLTSQQVITGYYKAAGITKAEYNTAAGFDKAQKYAESIGEGAIFNKAIADRKRNN
jgi:hypothetical protein